MKLMEVVYGTCTVTHGGYMGGVLAFVVYVSDSASLSITPPYWIGEPARTSSLVHYFLYVSDSSIRRNFLHVT